MPTLSKPKPVGRPKLANHEAKGKVVVVRLNAEDHKQATLAAKRSHQNLSEWIRALVHTATVLP